jgi:phage-related protein (TIGR01555 family)
MSIFAGMEGPIKRYEGAIANIASLLYEAKVDILTIPGLSDMFSDPDQEAVFTKMMQAMMAMKGINGALVLPGSVSKDGKDSTYDQKNISFATLPDLIVSFEKQVSAPAGIPHAVLFDRQNGGMGNNGDMELSNYYDRIGEMQSNDIEPRLAIFDECLIRSALGSRPPELWYEWNSLWQQSDKDKVENADKLAGAVQKLVSAGVIPAEVLSQPTVTGLVNIGVLPGLDQSYEEFISGGGEIVPEESEEDITPTVKPKEEKPEPEPVKDERLELEREALELLKDALASD